MNIFSYLRYLWFRYPTRGEREILARLDEIERKIDEHHSEISSEFADEVIRKLGVVDTAVKRIATDD